MIAAVTSSTLLNYQIMKTLKMSLENIQGKMSRNEMRDIMAGATGGCCVKSVSKVHGTYYWGCNYSKSEAIRLATSIGIEGEFHGFWCCSSC